MRKIIGVCGFIGSGKGTVGDILVNNYGYTKLSFADKLKDGTAAIFDWDRKLLEGDTKESRAWRDEPDEFWSEELGYEMTPRLALQLMGTDCMRNGFDPNIWVLTIKRQILDNPDTNFVIPDVRFINERKIIKELSGQVWQLSRGKQPEWMQKAISDNRYETQWMKDYDVHVSEWAWCDNPEEFDRNILNDGSKDDLASQISTILGV